MQYNLVLEQIPKHLKQFIVDQHYERYTARDHAVWRYIMRVNLGYLRDHAHPAYLEGLQKTGVGVEKIPHIDEMNASLQKIGWKAVIVDGFLPPAVFMEFQFRKILAISADMRSIQHLLYTPAPDIVHEAAGHAPIIADEEYAAFLQKFGEYGMEAFSSKIDIEIYEAIRHLSIIKEYPETSTEEIARAEDDLNNKLARNTHPSEMTLLSRLHWWTVEYGLIGDLEQQKIYGAGLLSSVGESKSCLGSGVKKLPLTVEATNYNYDITKEQPQLFVNKNWSELLDVLEEFADTLSFRIGGAAGIETAIESEAYATCVYSSGLQVSGIFSRLIKDKKGNPAYISTSGPTSLSFGDIQLSGHDTVYHKDGFGSPVGKLADGKTLEKLSPQELTTLGITEGENVQLQFESGIRVQGVLKNITSMNGQLILLSFDSCTVLGADNKLLFDPSWGMYDMAVGAEVPSVFYGTADKEKHNVYPPKSDNIAIPIKYSASDRVLHNLYDQIRKMRELGKIDLAKLRDISKKLQSDYQEEWLLRLEILELLKEENVGTDIQGGLLEKLENLSGRSEELSELIKGGLHLLDR